ncbi:glutathione S-transferase family protein [Massilia sp. TWR1-2-2]|uniref:glutathione S-transferase family protein n=1 Tax=Massilia sp. TWR1-2-2 TaxID=2804584 RepID=UPI003CF36A13
MRAGQPLRLIGMLDSPYVRRVAIALDLLGVPFEHELLSVFSTFEQFREINPVVKAPTLVCADGAILMESSLILQFVEADQGRSLWPVDKDERRRAFEVVALALAACEKGAQIVYERNLRPAAAQHEPWVERVTSQLLAAYSALEQHVVRSPALFADSTQHPAMTATAVWGFTQAMLGELVPAADYPALAAVADRTEQTAPFLKYPSGGPGVPLHPA